MCCSRWGYGGHFYSHHQTLTCQLLVFPLQETLSCASKFKFMSYSFLYKTQAIMSYQRWGSLSMQSWVLCRGRYIDKFKPGQTSAWREEADMKVNMNNWGSIGNWLLLREEFCLRLFPLVNAPHSSRRSYIWEYTSNTNFKSINLGRKGKGCVWVRGISGETNMTKTQAENSQRTKIRKKNNKLCFSGEKSLFLFKKTSLWVPAATSVTHSCLWLQPEGSWLFPLSSKDTHTHVGTFTMRHTDTHTHIYTNEKPFKSKNSILSNILMALF